MNHKPWQWLVQNVCPSICVSVINIYYKYQTSLCYWILTMTSHLSHSTSSPLWHFKRWYTQPHTHKWRFRPHFNETNKNVQNIPFSMKTPYFLLRLHSHSLSLSLWFLCKLKDHNFGKNLCQMSLKVISSLSKSENIMEKMCCDKYPIKFAWETNQSLLIFGSDRFSFGSESLSMRCVLTYTILHSGHSHLNCLIAFYSSPIVDLCLWQVFLSSRFCYQRNSSR